MSHQGNDSGINIFEQISQICREFRKLLAQGQTPKIEQYVAKVSESGRETLFSNLLEIEINYRRSTNQSPSSEEYTRRFPQFSKQVRRAFFEPTMGSVDSASSLDDETRSLKNAAATPADTPTFDIPAANRLGDYRLLRELGRGGFGIVYAAQHVRRHEIVALKTLPLGDYRYGPDDAERLHKFRREFRSLADINHPNLVGMQTLEVDGGQCFFTMDLVDGVDFLSYVRPKGELDEARLRGVLPQTAAGIRALHTRHIIHRDLKPSNVMVDANGKVVILDFGLVAELEHGGDQTQSLQSGRFAGTPLYAAPEQFFGRRSTASDWYALGIMLYQALTDERPFHGSVVEIMQQKQQQSAPSLAGRDGLPADLAELTERLLAREPGQRPDALEIAKRCRFDADPTPTETVLEEGSTLMPGRDQALIGREQQLAELNFAKREFLMTRQPLALFITGRSGEGKTSLAEAFLAPVRQQREMLVLAGRCYDRESVPFKAIDCLIDALVSFLRGCPVEVVQAAIPDDMPMLAHLFPVLRRVEAINALPSSNVANLDGKQVRDRGFAALRQMLIRISQRRPIALFVDDVQWGDADSAAVLHRLLSPPEAPAVLLLGTYRSDETAESPFLQQWEKLSNGNKTGVVQREIAVGPLSEAHYVAMVAMRTGIDNDSIRAQATQFYRDTGGNPYFIEQLIECFDPQTGSFTPAPLQEVVARRLGKLPTAAVELLQVIAVFGQAMSIEEAFAVLGQENPSFATITHMRSERLVRLLGSEDQRKVDTYHDKIRETVISALSAKQRRNWHRLIGEMIERADRIDVDEVVGLVLSGTSGGPWTHVFPRPNDLAYHFNQAGYAAKALAYSILAAESARKQFAHEAAVEAYSIGQHHLINNPQIGYRLCSGLAESLVQLGRHEDAIKAANTAIDSTKDPLEKNLMWSLWAESEYRHGSVTRCVQILEQVLFDLRVKFPSTQRAALANIFGSLPWQFLWCAFSAKFGRRPILDKRSNLILSVLNRLVYPYHSGGLPKCVWACFFLAIKSISFGDSAWKAIASEATANAWVLLGATRKARKHYGRALTYAVSHNDLSAQNNIHRVRGAMLSIAGELENGLQSLEISATEYENRLPDFQRLLVTWDWKSRAHFLRGELVQAAQLSSRVFYQTVESGIDRWSVSALQSWTRSVEGRLPYPSLAACLGNINDPASAILLLNAEAEWCLAAKEFRRGMECADEAFAKFRNYWPMKSFNCSVIATAARSHREFATELANSNSSVFRMHLAKALSCANYGLWRVQLWRSEHSRLLREYSLATSCLGHPHRALRAAQKSCQIAEQQGAQYELAQSRMVVAELSQKLGLAGADALLREATQEMQRFKDMIDQAVAETVKP